MSDQQSPQSQVLAECPNPFKDRILMFAGSKCWIWKGAKTKRGYGHLSFLGKHVLAHRLMWILTFGAIHDGLEVCHSCDNPPCVNPEHLWLGTHSQNMKDAFKKGRLDITTPGDKGRETIKRIWKSKRRKTS